MVSDSQKSIPWPDEHKAIPLVLVFAVIIIASIVYFQSTLVNQNLLLKLEIAELYEETGNKGAVVRVLDEAISEGIRDPEILGHAGERIVKCTWI